MFNQTSEKTYQFLAGVKPRIDGTRLVGNGNPLVIELEFEIGHSKKCYMHNPAGEDETIHPYYSII